MPSIISFKSTKLTKFGHKGKKLNALMNRYQKVLDVKPLVSLLSEYAYSLTNMDIVQIFN